MYRVSKHVIVEDTEACEDITIGADHRAVRMEITILKRSRRNRKGCGAQAAARRSLWGWEAADQKDYEEQLNEAVGKKLNDWQLQQLPVKLEQKCQDIERILTDTGVKCQRTKQAKDAEDKKRKAILHELITTRKMARTAGQKDVARDASKLIQKEVRAVARVRRTAKIGKILEEFRGLRDITNIKNNMKTSTIPSVKCEDGSIATDRQDIVNTFAKFYGELYKRRGTDYDFNMFADEVEAVWADMVEEVEEELKKMLKRKACDTNGMVAEFLKASGEPMRKVVADVFSDLLKPPAEVPNYWRETRLKVIFKKGDPQNPENYRPICILPILYKLFSRILCARIKDILLKAQSVDQAGFRPGFSCDDHMFTITLLAEKMNEYNLPLWVVAVDFRKAFDTINHGSLWQV